MRAYTCNSGGSTGGGRGPGLPIFGKVNFSYIVGLYNVWKIFLKSNLDFIVAEIRWVFGSVGVFARVCESKSWPLLFFVQQRPNFEWYPRRFWSQKYMPDCRKSHLFFFKIFLGEAPQTPGGARAFDARFGASPPYRAPFFPKFLDPPRI